MGEVLLSNRVHSTVGNFSIMNLDRLRSPVEEFVNEGDLPNHQQQRWRMNNLDQRQQKYALGILVGVAGFSLLLGFLGMFGIAQNSMAMHSRLVHNSLVDEKFITEEIFQRINMESIKTYLNWLGEKPHPSGQTRETEIALWIKSSLEQLELDSVSVHAYEVMLSFPTGTNRVEVYDGFTLNFASSLEELDSCLAQRRGSDLSINLVQAFNAYSPKLSINETKPIYVNYARLEDFELLKQQTVLRSNLDHVMIARYGKISAREKVRNAMKHGAKGLILYADPEQVAPSGSLDVFPNSKWLPSSGIVRESLLPTYGDPQSPGLPSLPNVYKLPSDQLTWSLPTIPVQSIGYEDAKKLLDSVKGTEAYPGWSGKLGIQYNLGGVDMPNSKKVHLAVTNELALTKIQNIVGVIRGGVEPDRYVIVGTHRDSMGCGGADPSPGSAAMMGVIGAIRETMKAYGWRPRRSLVFVSFAASEFGSIGAQEWVEEHLPKLKNRVVSYLNMDSCVVGPDIDATASIPLRRLILKALKSVPDPMNPTNYKRTYFDFWKEKSSRGYNMLQEPYTGLIGGTGDFSPFVYLGGIPSLDLRFSTSEYNKSNLYPLHNSGYDNVDYFMKMIDPELKILQTCSQVMVFLIRELADSLVLPFDISQYKIALFQALSHVKTLAMTSMYAPIASTSSLSMDTILRQNQVNLDILDMAIKEYDIQARNWTKNLNLTNYQNDPMIMRMLNDQLMQLEKIFLSPNGIPYQNETQHIILAFNTSTQYGQATFPGIINYFEAFLATDLNTIDERNRWEGWDSLKRHISEIYVKIIQAASHLKAFHVI